MLGVWWALPYQTRLKPSGVLFYSDQGVHYTSQKLTESVAECENIAQSMSCRGNYWNNAPTERFPRSLKTEWISKGGYENIWGYYQTVRPHNFNDYFPPAEKEKRHFNQNLLSGVLN